MAVSQDGFVIYRFDNPSERLKVLAVKNNPWLAIAAEPIPIAIDRKTLDQIIAEKYPNKMFKPGQNFHKMLQYIAANPGSNRSGWFVHYLGLKAASMQGFDTDKAHDGWAALMGCITHRDPGAKASTYQLRITDRGRRVLDQLNQGNKLSARDIVSL